MQTRKIKGKKQRKHQHIFWITQIVFLGLFLAIATMIMFRLKQREKEVIESISSGAGMTDISSKPQEDVYHMLQEGAQEDTYHPLQEAVDDMVSEDKDLGNIPEYARSCELDDVGKPTKLEGTKLLNALKKLGETEEKISKIAENSDFYPEALLTALVSNPEMADFVSNYPSAVATDTAELTEEELLMEYPLFLQWDPRWGYQAYGESNVALAGCGPTSLAMALYYLTRDASMTPGALADYAMQNNYYMYGTGTLWALMEEVPIYYGVNSLKLEQEEDVMKQALDDGQILICSMRAGDFTVGGHFIVIYGYDDTGFLVNDPNCVARSRQTWGFEQLEKQMKQMWALSN